MSNLLCGDCSCWREAELGRRGPSKIHACFESHMCSIRGHPGVSGTGKELMMQPYHHLVQCWIEVLKLHVMIAQS